MKHGFVVKVSFTFPGYLPDHKWFLIESDEDHRPYGYDLSKMVNLHSRTKQDAIKRAEIYGYLVKNKDD